MPERYVMTSRGEIDRVARGNAQGRPPVDAHLGRGVDPEADSRERLDRQLAAHTEELRVQRSAIARAQRVLRNLTRPDDGGDGPPSASGGP